MIQAPDLRVGNYVIAPDLEGGHRVICVNSVGWGRLRETIVTDDDGVKYVGKAIKGIELVQDIVEEAGFSYRGPIMGWHRNELFLLFEENGWYMHQEPRYVSIKPLHYYHELQNLYFSLTGETLPKPVL